jgi:hypothetical protein
MKVRRGPGGPKKRAGGAGTGKQPRPSGKGPGRSHEAQMTGKGHRSGIYKRSGR